MQLPSQNALDEKGEEVTHRRQDCMALWHAACLRGSRLWALGFLSGWVFQSCPGTRFLFL